MSFLNYPFDKWGIVEDLAAINKAVVEVEINCLGPVCAENFDGLAAKSGETLRRRFL